MKQILHIARLAMLLCFIFAIHYFCSVAVFPYCIVALLQSQYITLAFVIVNVAVLQCQQFIIDFFYLYM